MTRKAKKGRNQQRESRRRKPPSEPPPPPAFDLLSPTDYAVAAALVRRCVAVAAERIGDAVFNLGQKRAPDPPVQYADDQAAFNAGYFRGIREAEAAIEIAARTIELGL